MQRLAILCVCMAPTFSFAAKLPALEAPPKAPQPALEAPHKTIEAAPADAAPTDGPALQTEAPPPEPIAKQRPKVSPLIVGASLGVAVPQVFGNRFGASFLVVLGAAYQLPVLDRQLGLFFQLGFQHPNMSKSGTDARLPGDGSYKATLVDQDLMASLGLQWVFTDMRTGYKGFTPYIGLAARLHMLRAVLDGAASGAAFGTNTETLTTVGGLLRVGVGYALGPGALVFELEAGIAPLTQAATGKTNIGSLGLMLGYHYSAL
jgi:hypothetical protein